MVKKILSYVKEYKAASVATPIWMVFEVIFETLIPICMASIVDEGVSAFRIEEDGNLSTSIICSIFSLWDSSWQGLL